jgi:hypothetical protein
MNTIEIRDILADRRELGMARAEPGKCVQVSREMVSRFENGGHDIGLKVCCGLPWRWGWKYWCAPATGVRLWRIGAPCSVKTAMPETRRLEIDSSQEYAGRLTRESQFVFNYRTSDAACEIALAVPLRAKSYAANTLPGVLRQNFPEGELHFRLKEHFGKTARMNDMDILALSGRQAIRQRVLPRQSPSGSSDNGTRGKSERDRGKNASRIGKDWRVACRMISTNSRRGGKLAVRRGMDFFLFNAVISAIFDYF